MSKLPTQEILREWLSSDPETGVFRWVKEPRRNAVQLGECAWLRVNVEAKGMIVVTLPFPPSTNNLFINTSRGRIRSSKYDEWAVEAGWELKRQRPPKVTGPVMLSFDFQSNRDKRKRDITNLLKAPEDLLVKFGVIEADDNTIVQAISAGWSESVEGVRITITPIAGEDDGRSQQQCPAQGDSGAHRGG